jgi:hypothetical protein
LVPTVPEATRADELRAQMMALLRPVCMLIESARRDGLVVGFNLGTDPAGRQVVRDLIIARHY